MCWRSTFVLVRYIYISDTSLLSYPASGAALRLVWGSPFTGSGRFWQWWALWGSSPGHLD
jgi:hypothetical protein